MVPATGHPVGAKKREPADRRRRSRLPAQRALNSASDKRSACLSPSPSSSPPLLIADEATSALDVITQSEILDLFARLNGEIGMSILYISHDLPSVAGICQRIAILHEGQIVECGPTQQIFTAPAHPYTCRLMSALPQVPVRREVLLARAHAATLSS